MSISGVAPRVREYNWRQWLIWLDELAWLCEQCGFATATLWHSCIRPEVSQTTAERHYLRLLNALDESGLPHDHIQLIDRSRGVNVIGTLVLYNRHALEKLLSIETIGEKL